MSKGASGFKTHMSSMLVLLVAFAFVGCAKKVSPVVGSEGISGDDTSTAASSQKGGSGPGGSAQADANKGMGSDGRSQDMTSSGNSNSGNQGTGMDEGMMHSDGMTSSKGSSMPGHDMGEPAPMFEKNVYFDFDKWTIRGDARDMLTENARWLVANAGASINIEGHGDERGTAEYNLALGERRARSTKRYLMNLGVSSSRISYISYGEEKAVCDEKTEGCFQQNRRAHFVVK